MAAVSVFMLPVTLGQCQPTPTQVYWGNPTPHPTAVTPPPGYHDKTKVLRGLDDVQQQLDDVKRTLDERTGVNSADEHQQ